MRVITLACRVSEGSAIVGYQALAFDTFRLPTGPAERDASSNWQVPNALALEGKVTGHVYALPPGTATLEVFRITRTRCGPPASQRCSSAMTTMRAAMAEFSRSASTPAAISCRMAGCAVPRRRCTAATFTSCPPDAMRTDVTPTSRCLLQKNPPWWRQRHGQHLGRAACDRTKADEQLDGIRGRGEDGVRYRQQRPCRPVPELLL